MSDALEAYRIICNQIDSIVVEKDDEDFAERMDKTLKRIRAELEYLAAIRPGLERMLEAAETWGFKNNFITTAANELSAIQKITEGKDE